MMVMQALAVDATLQLNAANVRDMPKSVATETNDNLPTKKTYVFSVL